MAKEKNLYGNWSILDQDDKLLSNVSKKRAMWFLNKDLGELIEHNTIRLKFEPKGRSSDDYTLTKKENRCVVCGSTKIRDLTKHHVVPSMYKKLFPIKFKERSSHDIVIICRVCHNNYEQNFANIFKNELAIKYNAPINTPTESLRSITIARTIIKYWDDLPGDRLEVLLDEFKKITKIEPNNFEELYEYIEQNEKEIYESLKITHPQIVINEYLKNNNLFDFIVTWRKHFIDSTNPKYMPDGWDINYKFCYNERK